MERILIIDDDPICLQTLALTLKRGRPEESIETAKTAEEAIL